MVKKIISWPLAVLAWLLSMSSTAVELTYYLPDSADYEPSISTPEAALGFQVGDWHVRPELIERYFNLLAQQSPRVKLEITGYTHEKRPLMLAYISSPENIRHLEEIRLKHLSGKDKEQTPLITWMGYSVHGNEASGANSSLLLAYHLAAAKDKATLAKLNNQVIIIDPMLNPDGLGRFAQWVNSHKSKTPNPDPNDIEHHESWPNGRTNHYWFDLNRDWLLLQHPESKARVTKFHEWRPNVLTDFHEMGTNSSYFFQPGVPSRQNPLTPQANFKMTATIAEYHAKALDEIGSLYYSKENFDDFYYGKGSTYPDIHGTVGILFEQASARGHVQKGNYGEVSFPFAIRNHLTTSLSTLEAAQQNRKALKNMGAEFAKESMKLAQKDKNRAIVISSIDTYRLQELGKVLQGHRIEYRHLAKSLEIKSRDYQPQNSLIIPLQQPQYRLIQAMFETRTEFADQVFYDVSAWNLAMAFDLDYDFVSRSDYDKSLLGSTFSLESSQESDYATAVALAFDWSNFNSARLLSELHQKGLRVQAVTKPTRLKTKLGEHSLPLGSIILALNNQPQSRAEIIRWLNSRLQSLDLSPIAIQSGLALSGVDLGSPSIPVIKPIKPVLLVGDSVSGYAAGEIWHLLDQRLAQPVTMMPFSQFLSLAENDYTHLIFPDSQLKPTDKQTAALSKWVKRGGVVIALNNSAKWLTAQQWTSSKAKVFDKPINTKVAYSEKDQVRAEHVVGGSIASAVIDTSHPLGFGMDNPEIAIFKRGQLVFTEPKESFVAVARFAEKPLASGYMSEENQTHIAGGTSILVQALGRGRLIAFSDNPVFRGYWLGTAKVFTNALYFAKNIQAPAKTKDKSEDSVNGKSATGNKKKIKKS